MGSVKKAALHLVAKIVRIETFQPFLKSLAVSLVGRGVRRTRPVHDEGLDEHGRLGAQRQRERVTGPRVDKEDLAVANRVTLGR